MRLELRGGDRLSGTIVAETENYVTLQTRFGTEIDIPQEEILRVAWEEPAAPDEAPAVASDAVDEAEEDDLEITGELEIGAAIVASATNRRDYLSKLDFTFRRGDRRCLPARAGRKGAPRSR